MRTDQQPVRIALFAPDGRMGKAIQAAIAKEPGFQVDNDHGEVLIDFSAPDALRASLDRAVSAGVPLLIGTTGLIDEHAHHWLILHGRYICKARTPECWRCPVADLCAYKPKTPAPKVKTSAAPAAR